MHPDPESPSVGPSKGRPARRTGGFARLAFEQYRTGLHRYLLRRLQNTEHARDLSQEVYLRLLRFTEQDLVQQPEAYLYRVAYNVLCDFKLREGQSRVEFDSEAFERQAMTLPDEADSQEDICDREIRESRLENVLMELPPMQRAVFLMQKRRGLSYQQTAKELGLSVKTVKTYLFRAVCHCRKSMEGSI